MGLAREHALQHPIGLCWLGACLEQAGFAPSIVDYEVEPWSPKQLAQTIRDRQPPAVGITAMTPNIVHAAEIADVIKTERPETFIMLGGAHASILPLRSLEEFPAFDAVCTGEGEERIVALCRAVRDNTLEHTDFPGCAVRTPGGVRDFTNDPGPRLELDTLPLPARHLLHLEKYKGASTPGIPSNVFRATELFTSRGCPGKCIFCCSEHMFGRGIKFRSVEHVMAEVDQCMGRYGFNHFTIDDDTFTTSKKRVLEFCEQMAQRNATWDCDTRVDHMDRELAGAMARAGCIKVAFGVESGSQNILDLINKNISLDQIRRAFSIMHEAGIMTCAFLMVGNHPQETQHDIDLTWKLVRDIKPDLISVMIATPYPGTQLFEIMKNENLVDDVPWTAYAQSFEENTFSRTHTMSPDELKKQQKRLLRKFYLRPGYIKKRLEALKTREELMYWMHAGMNFMRHILKMGKQSE